MSYNGRDGGGFNGRDFLPPHLQNFANLTPHEQLLFQRQLIEAEDQHRRAVAQQIAAAEAHSVAEQQALYRRQLQMEIERDMQMRRQQALYDQEAAAILAQRQRQQDHLLLSPSTAQRLGHLENSFHLSPAAEQQLAMLQRQAIERQQSADREYREQLMKDMVANARRSATPKSPENERAGSARSQQSAKPRAAAAAKAEPKNKPAAKGKKKPPSPAPKERATKSPKPQPEAPVVAKKAPEKKAPEKKAAAKSKPAEKKEKETKAKGKPPKPPAAPKAAAAKKTAPKKQKATEKVPSKQAEAKTKDSDSINSEKKEPEKIESAAPATVQNSLEGLLQAMEASKEQREVKADENTQVNTPKDPSLMLPNLAPAAVEQPKSRLLTGTEGELVGILRTLKSDDAGDAVEKSPEKPPSLLRYPQDATNAQACADEGDKFAAHLMLGAKMSAATEVKKDDRPVNVEQTEQGDKQEYYESTMRSAEVPFESLSEEQQSAALLGSMKRAKVSEPIPEVASAPSAGLGGLAALIAHLEDSAPDVVSSQTEKATNAPSHYQTPMETTSSSFGHFSYEQQRSLDQERSDAMNPTYSKEDSNEDEVGNEKMDIQEDEEEDTLEDDQVMDGSTNEAELAQGDDEDNDAKQDADIKKFDLTVPEGATVQREKRPLDISVDDAWYPTDKAILRERRVRDYSIGSSRGRNAGWRNVPPLEKRMKADPEYPGVLEKIPHCRIHVRWQQKKGITPQKALFCFQVTEMHPTEVMVCCSMCSTWRHAACGGHHKWSSSQGTLNPRTAFVPVCDQCAKEQAVLQRDEELQKAIELQRLEHLRKSLAMNQVARYAAFSKHSGTYKWPLGSVSSTHIGGHTRSVNGRHEKAEKQWADMITKLETSTYRPREHQKIRTREFERLLNHIEEAGTCSNLSANSA